MNTKQLIASATLLFATGAVFAQQTDYIRPDANFVSTQTRAQVTAELQQAQANGDYVVGGKEFVAPVTRLASGKTRTEVLAELKQAQADGSYLVGGREYAGQRPVQHSGSDAKNTAIAHNSN